MSLRISVLEEVKKKQSQSKSTFRTLMRSPSPTSFYVRSQHISRRPKSPFRKYEQCIIEANNKPIVSTPKVDYVSNISTQTTYINSRSPSRIKSTFCTRKIPVDPSDIKNRNQYKKVNKFEDLVIACVDSGPVVNPNDLICYKNRYLVNLTDSNWNLCSMNESFNHQSTFSENKLYNYQCKNTTTTRNGINVEKSFVEDKIEIKETSDSTRNILNSGEFKKSVHFSSQIESSDTKNEVTSQQPPLGTPEHLETEKEDHKNNLDSCSDNDDDPFTDINVNPETVEQFINLLIAEDKMLRKKIADGHVDEKCLKRLERLTELRQKYLKFKEQQKIDSENEYILENENICSKQIKAPINEKSQTIKPRYIPKKGILCARSLSDAAFSAELKFHPLIQDNSYLVSTLN